MHRPLNNDFRNGGVVKLLLHGIANLDIAVQKLRHLLRGCVPTRPPVAVHAQSKSNWINFLSHKTYFFPFLARFPDFSAFASVAPLPVFDSLAFFFAAFCAAFRVSRV